MKVMIIEDSIETIKEVSMFLQIRWPLVEISASTEGPRAVETLRSNPYDLLILDAKLPDMNSFHVLQKVRQFCNIPTIILGVQGPEEDQIQWLEMGADAYIVKPFSPRDFVARVNVLFRRDSESRIGKERTTISRGKLTLNLAGNEVTFREKKVRLTPIESKLLYVMMENSDLNLTGEGISNKVWGLQVTNTNRLRTYIRRLRDKLDDNPPRVILTEFGKGYIFVTPT